MKNRKALYEGKAKTIYEGPEPGTLIQYFKDDATSDNAQKHEVIDGKGVLNNRISAHIMAKLEEIGIPTHFIRSLNMREQLVRQVEIVPLEVVVRNIATGSIVSRLGVEEGSVFHQPLIEFHYKKEGLDDPIVSEQHIMAFGWADPYELEEIVHLTLRINDFLAGLFGGIGLKLIDFKLEFGRIWGNDDDLYIILADEITPDHCRLWDSKTGERMDKDRFRKGLGDLIDGYQEIAKRLGLIPQTGIMDGGNINEEIAEQLEEIENAQAKARKLRAVKKTKTGPTRR